MNTKTYIYLTTGGKRMFSPLKVLQLEEISKVLKMILNAQFRWSLTIVMTNFL